MDFQDVIKALGEKVSRLQESIQTEEATKMAFVMPFISALGYDVFNPMEVVPEYVADLGIKKGEKVDYCIFKDGAPSIIIECKHWKEKLDVHNSQLHRYFHVTAARFGVLTNGITYRFYTDLVEANKMDDKPFWEFNITEVNEHTLFELKKYHKSHFSLENILSSATELKYAKEIKRIMLEEMASPSDAFVKHFTKQIVSGAITAKVLEQFTGLVKKSINGLVTEMISDRLKSALASEEDRGFVHARVEEDTTVQPVNSEPINKVVTTEMEKEAFYIVRSILRGKVDANRVFHRDTQSYFGILLDDNNRRPICRLNLEGAKKTIVLFDEAKKESRHEIQSLDDIYAHADQLINTALSYDMKAVSAN
ncbi:type I restriction endonuclease [Rufibacter sediminis]|uniref:Type I restriction enzyme HsdR N-terminal domain-containing protein n=1 Tax=Rufibacter sediminis TaxID=2762756 RepID=A0ABR6VTE3_9BACT|nr:type I restriction endonuclease [Rufibacter sediminis]MBC3540113.1 type I restriction enzyme HsdR N-terminal domain-containing protein [Rufibacter sediminis]